jgi:nucleotide-binding universal stress UspA family protein
MDWQPKVIVVGVDGSETSHAAAEHAVAMARPSRSSVTLRRAFSQWQTPATPI